MQLEIRYATSYEYEPAAASGLTALRVVPRPRPGLTVSTTALHVAPGVLTRTYLDGWGTRVDLVESRAHGAMEFSVTAHVETGGEAIDDELPADLEVMYRRDSARVRRAAVAPLIAQLGLQPRGWTSVETLASCLRQWFTYRTGVTDASTQLETVLDTAEGVCQDIAHVFIAALRLWGWCARYASGYVYTNGAESGRVEAQAMHAWVEVYRRGTGWIGLDPTHGAYADDTYVLVATGRDYDDVRPVRGVVNGVQTQRQSAQLIIHNTAGQ